MSKLSIIEEVGRISGSDFIKENPYKQERLIKAWKEVNTPPIEVRHKVCPNHDIVYALIGEPCPRCKRLSIFSHE